MSAIKMYRGDSKTLSIKVQKSDESGYDVTGMKVILTVKETDDDAAAVILHSRADAPVDSSFALVLSPTATQQIEPGVYPFDIELSNDDRSFVATLTKGYFTILRDITTGDQ